MRIRRRSQRRERVEPMVATETVIRIRGGVDEELMMAHQARVKKDEEAERARENAERERKNAELAKIREQYAINHPNLCKHLYASYYNQNPYYGSSRTCKSFFYEWSDIHSTPKVFETHRQLMDWLDCCDILMDEKMYGKLINLNEAYFACKSNGELIMCETYNDLCTKLST